MADPEIRLSGGKMTSVVRAGNTVRRSTGPWSPAVHCLLRHLEAVGFNAAPRFLEMDEHNREVLTYLEGDVGFFASSGTVPSDLWSDRVLVDAATLLRRFHDATVGFVLPPGMAWVNSGKETGPQEVICHNDFAPYNCIFQAGQLHAVIDFDGAGPGLRTWDLAYTAYSFVPLFTEAGCRAAGLAAQPDRARRLRLCCDAYGLEDRSGFVETIERRVRFIAETIRSAALAGDSRFQRQVEEGHDLGFAAAAAELCQERTALQAAL